MANFNQAIKWLREGKKVRRPSWDEDSYWELGIDEVIRLTNGPFAHVHLNQIEANDWEIFKDSKKVGYDKLPKIKLLSKRDFKELKHKYEIVHSWDEKTIEDAIDSDVLVFKVLFQNGKHCIHQVWILNESTPELFMELMFGKKIGFKK